MVISLPSMVSYLQYTYFPPSPIAHGIVTSNFRLSKTINGLRYLPSAEIHSIAVTKVRLTWPYYSRYLRPTGHSESVAGEGCGDFLVEAFTKQPNISKRQPSRLSEMSYGVERSSRRGRPQTQSTGVHSRGCGLVPTPKLRSEFACVGRRNVGNYLSMLLNVRTHR